MEKKVNLIKGGKTSSILFYFLDCPGFMLRGQLLLVAIDGINL